MSDKDLQQHINKEVQEDINKLYDHAKIANSEMGVIKTDIGIIKGDIANLKDKAVRGDAFAEKLDNRTWLILATIVVGFLAQIVLGLLK